MSLRLGFLSLMLLSLCLQVGCACCGPAILPGYDPWPCGKTYYGSSCGCRYWHEWFSHKPQCCDPCNQCGEFTCSNNPYVKTGPPRAVYSDGTGSSMGSSSKLNTSPTPARPNSSQPTPAQPMSVEEFESMGPTTSMPHGGQHYTARRGSVDSSHGSRTLGNSPRTRLFSR